MTDETFDAEIGIRQSCQFCDWKSDSYQFGYYGEQAAEDELVLHQRDAHPRAQDGTRIGVYEL